MLTALLFKSQYAYSYFYGLDKRRVERGKLTCSQTGAGLEDH